MSRRLIAGLIAAFLAVLAGALVLLYASGADRRAMSELSPTQVLVVAEQVPAGTPAEALEEHLEIEELPATAVVPGGVRNLAQLEGMVATTQLEPGEQLLATRFARPEDLKDPEAVDIPEGFHQLSIALSKDRVIGGHLKAGDTVGFFVSGGEGQTHLRLHKVLVAHVQGGVTTVTQDDGSETTQPAADSLIVTLAVSAPDAELIVNAAQFHSIWLSLEPADAPEQGTRIVDGKDLLP